MEGWYKMVSVEAALLPFKKNTVANQAIIVGFNRKRYLFTLEYNSTGKFFVLRAEREGVVCFNEKLAEVPVIGRNPDTFFPEFIVAPIDVSLSGLELWLTPMSWT
jgi:predicted amidohydrolase